MISILIHASGVACFGYALYYDLFHVHLPAHMASSAAFSAMQAFPGKWKYLTVWDIVLQLVYHSVGLANDLFGSSEVVAKRQSALQRFRDGLFASWAFPVGLFVSASFWGLYALDRALVFPKEMDAFYPAWLNQAVHTGPVTFLLLEALTVPKLRPGRTCTLTANLGFSLTYLAWITWVFSQNGVWAYPILEVLNNGQRGIFFGTCCLCIVGFYFLGEKLNQWRWGSEDSKAVSGKANGAKAKNVGKGKKKAKLT
ncbi:Androgen-induced protein [Orchesella cincta]|uniref:Androgen-induced protein n=1 Tax=Orchesella cincta TaxID=48709 RepID=A0A1D2N952_ORCCI|nr:Androgen-induced protein [Orchesella cincta]